MALRDNLKRLREAAGLSGKELAKQISMNYASYMTYENPNKENSRWPNEETLLKIAAALHVSLDDLLGYHPDEYDKAVRLFKESVKCDIQLNGEYVSFIPNEDESFKRWSTPIKKEDFINAMNEALQEFNHDIRPQLIRANIIQKIDWTYLQTLSMELGQARMEFIRIRNLLYNAQDDPQKKAELSAALDTIVKKGFALRDEHKQLTQNSPYILTMSGPPPTDEELAEADELFRDRIEAGPDADIKAKKKGPHSDE